MTQIITGNGVGVHGSSLDQLGGYGPKGVSLPNAGRDAIYVNAATGNLVLRHKDGFLAEAGVGVDLLQTWNSREAAAGWRFNTATSLSWVGTPNKPGSEIIRIAEDGHRTRFVFDVASGTYLDAAGSRERIRFSRDTWIWQDGDARVVCEYGSGGRLVAWRDRDGHSICFQYTDGVLCRVVDKSARQTVTWVMANGRLSEIRMESDGKLIHRESFDYDTPGRLKRISRDLGNDTVYWTEYGYEGDSALVQSIRESDGTGVTISYDALGRVKTLTDAAGHTAVWNYDSSKTTITNAQGEAWTYQYDREGRMTRVEGPSGYLIQYTYEKNHLATVTQGHRIWRFGWNDAGDCIRIEEPSGIITRYTYDAEHRRLSMTKTGATVNGQAGTSETARWIYDESGHLRFEIAQGGTVTEHRYNPEGFLKSSRIFLDAPAPAALSTLTELEQWRNTRNLQQSVLTEYDHDWRGQLCEEIRYAALNASGEGLSQGAMITRMRYDAAGRLVEKVLPLGKSVSGTWYAYDDLDRLVLSVDSDGRTSTTVWDDAHRQVTETDARGLQTVKLYDRSGLLLSEQKLDTAQQYGTTGYRYDKAGRLLCQIHPDGLRTWYLYDGQGRLQGTVSPAGELLEYTYDDEGRQTGTTRYATFVNMRVWEGQIPDIDAIRPAKTSADRGTSTFYNTRGQIAMEVDSAGAVTVFSYDGMGHLSGKRLCAMRGLPPPSHQDDRVLRYYHDADGQLTGQVDGEGVLTVFRYDLAGRLLETRQYAKRQGLPAPEKFSDCVVYPDDAHDIRTFSFYNAAGYKIADIDPEGTLTEYTLDVRGLVITERVYATSIQNIPHGATLKALRPPESGRDHVSFVRYDDAGRKTEVHDWSGLVTLCHYDAGGLLCQKTRMDAKTHEQRTEKIRYDGMGRIMAVLDGEGCRLLQQAAASEDAVRAVWEHHAVHYTYDAAGRQSTVTDALGHVLRNFHDERGRLRYVVDADGVVREYRYNALGEVVTTIGYSQKLQGGLESLTTTLLYEKLKDLRDVAHDEVRTFGYNAAGLLETEACGVMRTSTDWNLFGEIAKIRKRVDSRREMISSYRYDRRGLKVQETEGAGSSLRTRSLEYDSFGFLVRETDPRNGVSNWERNRRGENIRFTNAGRQSKTTTWDAFGRVLTETDFTDKTVVRRYSRDDANHAVRLEVGSALTLTVFNAFGDTLSVTDANGYTTTWTFDARGLMTGVDGPEHWQEVFHYDDAGRLSWKQGGEHTKIAWEYDAAGHVLQECRDPDGLKLVSTWKFDGLGRQLEVTDPANTVTRNTWDANGFLTEQCVDPAGLHLLTRFTRDDTGALIRETRVNPGGKDLVTAWERDAAGRCIKKRVDPDGLNLTTCYEYDANDNLISETDPEGHTTRFVFDVQNRCRFRIDPVGGVTEHQYDENGREIATFTYANRTDALTEWTENSVSKAIQRDPATDHAEYRTFDVAGHVLMTWDALGYAVQNTWDAAGNLVAVMQFAAPVSPELLRQGKRPVPSHVGAREQINLYDGQHRLRYQMDGTGVITGWIYDEQGHTTSMTRYFNPVWIATTRTLDIDAIQELLTPDASQDETTRFTWDKAGRLAAQLDPAGAATTWQYDATGHPVATRQHARLLSPTDCARKDWVKLVREDTADRVQRSLFDAAGREIYRIAAGGEVMERQYDANGNVTRETQHALVLKLDTWTLKHVAFALERDQRAHTTAFAYDSVARLWQKTDATGAETRFTYDGAGNINTRRDANGAVWIFHYDSNNCLLETISPMVSLVRYENGTVIREYRSVITRNTWDSFGNLVMEVLDAEGIAQVREFVWDARGQKIRTVYPDVRVDNSTLSAGMDRQERACTLFEEMRYNAFGEVVAQKTMGGSWSHKVYDEHGLLVFETDADGALTQSVYDTLGRMSGQTRFANRILLDPDKDYRPSEVLSAVVPDEQDRHVYYQYDLAGRLTETMRDKVRTFDPKTREALLLAPVEKQFYNAFGEVVKTSTLRNVNQWIQTWKQYDANGKLIAEVNPSGYLTRYTWDVYGGMASITEYATRAPADRVSIFDPPPADGKDRTVTFGYDALGRMILKTLKKVSVQSVDTANKLKTSVQDLQTHFTWDAMSNLTSTTDPLGNVAFNYFNALGQKIAEVGPSTSSGRSAILYAYDGLGQLVSALRRFNGAIQADETQFILGEHAAEDALTTNVYDSAGRLAIELDGKKHAVYYSYDAAGNMARSWQAVTRVDGSQQILDKRYTHDAMGRLLKTFTLKADGKVASQDARFNAFGEQTASGVNGVFALHSDYDRLGRIWRSNADGFYRIYLRDLTDNVTGTMTASNAVSTQTDARGVDLSREYYETVLNFDTGFMHYGLQRQYNQYDASGNLVLQTRERFTEGVEEKSLNLMQDFDRFGNVVKQVSASGHVTRYEYNALNKVTRQELPFVTIVDEHGEASRLAPVQLRAWDALGREIGFVDANGHQALKHLDALGHVTEEIDARGNARKKAYDNLGRLLKTTSETDVVVEYAYDRNNRLESVNTHGRVEKLTYDEAGRLIRQMNLCNEATEFDWDEFGNQILRREASGVETAFTYDDAGHKTGERDDLGHTQTWEYDAMGQLYRHQDLGGHETTMTRNVNGLLLSETSTAGKHTKYGYLSDGSLREYTDVATREYVGYTWDDEGRIKTRESSRGGDFETGWELERDVYDYDPLGRMTRMHRLAPQGNASRWVADFAWDAVGNMRHARISANLPGKKSLVSDNWYRYDENDRLVINKGILKDGAIIISQTQGTDIVYDAAGNVREAKTWEGNMERTYSYLYDDSGLLEHIRKNGKSFESRSYDVTGRLKKTASFDVLGHKSGAVELVYEKGQLVRQVNRNGSGDTESTTNYDYDLAGNLKKSATYAFNADRRGGTYLTHQYSYALWDTYVQARDETELRGDGIPKPKKGLATRTYDVNGLLQEVVDQQKDSKGSSTSARYWNSSLDGMHARRDERGMMEYLQAGNNLFGDIASNGSGQDSIHMYGGFTPVGKRKLFGSASFEKCLQGDNVIRLSDFFDGKIADNDESLKQMQIDPNDAVPGGNPGTYTLETGDTLEQVAMKVYGDSSLWYLIADANGITDRHAVAVAGGQLQPGQRLEIPSMGNTPHHTSATRSVSAQAKQLGLRAATTPTPLPAPEKHHKTHKLFEKIATAVLTLVVTVLAAAAIASGFGVAASQGIFQLGLGVLHGAATGGTMGLGASMGAAFGAASLGALSGQNAAEAFGLQQGLDWNSILAAGLASMAALGMGAMPAGGRLSRVGEKIQNWIRTTDFSVNSAAQTMTGDVVSQSLNLAMHRKQHFDWAQLGLNSVSAGLWAGERMQHLVRDIQETEPAAEVLVSEIPAISMRGATRLLQEKPWSTTEVLVDQVGSVASHWFAKGMSWLEDAYADVTTRLSESAQSLANPDEISDFNIDESMQRLEKSRELYEQWPDTPENKTHYIRLPETSSVTPASLPGQVIPKPNAARKQSLPASKKPDYTHSSAKTGKETSEATSVSTDHYPSDRQLTYDEMRKLVRDNNLSGQSDELIIAIAWNESNFMPWIKNKSKNSTALGLMQVTKDAASDIKERYKYLPYEHPALTDPVKNIRAGSKYLALQGDWVDLRIANSKKPKGLKLLEGLEGKDHLTIALAYYGTGLRYAETMLAAEAALKAKPDNWQEILRKIHP